MLSGSAILRVAVLVVVAAVLATLVQIYWPYAGGEAGVETRATPVPSTPAPARPVPAAAERVAAPPPVPAPSPAAPEPRTTPDQAYAPVTPPQPLPPQPLAPQPLPTQSREPPPAMPMQDAAGAAADATGPRALSVLDLNSASLSELNGLQGGGAIGKAIIRGRPYSSVDQLLSKRVLSKSTYQRIKDQVTVR